MLYKNLSTSGYITHILLKFLNLVYAKKKYISELYPIKLNSCYKIFIFCQHHYDYFSIIMWFFFREFQLMASPSNDRFLSSN